MSFDQQIVELYTRNIRVALPLTVFLIKILVRWISREPAKDVFRSVLTFPIDFMYIAIGLVLTAIAQKLPQFMDSYKTPQDAYLGAIFWVGGLILVAALVVRLDSTNRMLFQKFFAAWTLYAKSGKQLEFPYANDSENEPADDDTRRGHRLLGWMLLFTIGFVFFGLLEVILGVGSLMLVLDRVT